MTAPLHASDTGSGSAIVLLHAFPLDGRMWDEQRAALSRHARVIIPDLRGFGRSARGLDVPSLDDHADDVAALLDRLDVERATVVGLSMGGYVALSFASRHRRRLARLALCDTRAAADTPEGRAGRDANIALVEREGLAPLVERLLPNLLGPAASPGLVDQVRALANEQSGASVSAALLSMRDRPDRTALLPTLSLPATVIIGASDAIVPVAEARAMAALLPDAVVEVIARAGHLANLEAPGAFTASLTKLLAR